MEVPDTTEKNGRVSPSTLHSAKQKKRGIFHRNRDPLHDPKSHKELRGALAGRDPNAKNSKNNAPIHSIVQYKLVGKKKKEERMHYLVTLLTYAKVDVNLMNGDGQTPLHLAVMSGDPRSIKVLIAFGADLSALNCDNLTPLGILGHPHLLVSMTSMLSIGSQLALLTSESGDTDETDVPQSQAASAESQTSDESQPASSDDTFLEEIEENPYHMGMKKAKKLTMLLTTADTEAGQKSPALRFANVARQVITTQKLLNHQRYEHIFQYYSLLHKFFKTQVCTIDSLDKPLSSVVDTTELLDYIQESRMVAMAGARILCLDGGGMRALIEIEILSRIEKATGKKIIDLFDVIIGSSAGGLIALGLVYGKMTIAEMQQFLFKARQDVMTPDGGGIYFDTAAQEKIFWDQIGTVIRMCDVKHPRVIVPATNKESVNLKLHLFSNIFEDDLTQQLVWKVARYTSAAPIFLTEKDNYVDAGVLANNPSAVALTAIQAHFRRKGQRLPISMVVSIGTGQVPDSVLGNTDVTEILHPGRNFLKVLSTLGDRIKSITTLFSNAITESETVSELTRCLCEAENIDYFRFSPKLTKVISSTETNLTLLMDLIISARCLTNDDDQFQEMIKVFERVQAFRSRLLASSYTEKLQKLKEILKDEEKDSTTSEAEDRKQHVQK